MKKPQHRWGSLVAAKSGGDRIRTCDLEVMSLASYLAAPPRVSCISPERAVPGRVIHYYSSRAIGQGPYKLRPAFQARGGNALYIGIFAYRAREQIECDDMRHDQPDYRGLARFLAARVVRR